MSDFKGKSVLITGAASGIGAAAFKQLRDRGAEVIGTDIDFDGHDGEAVRMDVSSPEDWRRVVGRCRTEFGGLDILINCAGILREAPITETSLEMWNQVLAVNLTGVFLGMKEVIPIMRGRGGGSIVNVASIDGIRGNMNHIAYAASKGGIVSLTMAAALDHAKDGIRVNAVCPGTILTGMIKDKFANAADPAAVERYMLEKHPLGYLGRPEEAAEVVLFLAGPRSSFMTGQAVAVDGGRSIR